MSLPPEKRHDEILKLVRVLQEFTDRMWEKLAEKVREGWHGWDHPKEEAFLKEKLLRNAQEGDWRDVANLSMFLDHIDADGLTGAQFGRTVNYTDPRAVRDMLLLVVDDPLATFFSSDQGIQWLHKREDYVRSKLYEWAAAVHFAASDNPVGVPDRPDVLVGLEEELKNRGDEPIFVSEKDE